MQKKTATLQKKLIQEKSDLISKKLLLNFCAKFTVLPTDEEVLPLQSSKVWNSTLVHLKPQEIEQKVLVPIDISLPIKDLKGSCKIEKLTQEKNPQWEDWKKFLLQGKRKNNKTNLKLYFILGKRPWPYQIQWSIATFWRKTILIFRSKV